MRVVAAIAILIIGGALGYGWHEVSPRVLGSAPFCGPKYPGMLQTIPEDEYFPDEMFYEDSWFNHATERNDAYADDADWEWVERPWLEETLLGLGEPSLWQLSQEGTRALRWIHPRRFDYTTIVTVIYGENGASVRAHHVSGPRAGPSVVYDRVERDLPEHVANTLWHIIVGEDDWLVSQNIWRKCTEGNGYPEMFINEDFESLLTVWESDPVVLEVAEDGRYIFVSDLGMGLVGSSFLNVSGLPHNPNIPANSSEGVLPDRSTLEFIDLDENETD